MSLFSSRLRELRKKNRKKQNEIASYLGTTPQNYMFYEKGREPSYDNLIMLCNYFNVSADYLLGRSDHYSEDDRTLAEFVKKEFNNFSSHFEELLKLKLFHQLIYFSYAYIIDKGKKLYLYDSEDTDKTTPVAVITSEQRYMTIIRRVLEEMSQEYFLEKGFPENRDISFDIDRLDNWEIELEENMKERGE